MKLIILFLNSIFFLGSNTLGHSFHISGQSNDTIKSDFNNDGINDVCYLSNQKDGLRIIAKLSGSNKDYTESFNIEYPEMTGYDKIKLKPNLENNPGLIFHYFNSSAVSTLQLFIYFDNNIKKWFLKKGVLVNPIRTDYDNKVEKCFSKYNTEIRQLQTSIEKIEEEIQANKMDCKTEYKVNRKLDEIYNFYKSADKGEILTNGGDVNRTNAYLNAYPISNQNVGTYNDIGFYMEQAGLFHEATYLLNFIVNKFPNRAVAYINLADAYFGLKNLAKAKEAYNTYISLMKKSGKEAKIPKRVYDRIK